MPFNFGTILKVELPKWRFLHANHIKYYLNVIVILALFLWRYLLQEIVPASKPPIDQSVESTTRLGFVSLLTYYQRY